LGWHHVGKGHHWVCLIDGEGQTVWSSKAINDEADILEAIGQVRSRAARVTWAVDDTNDSRPPPDLLDNHIEIPPIGACCAPPAGALAALPTLEGRPVCRSRRRLAIAPIW
jgi:hypothetical protein